MILPGAALAAVGFVGAQTMPGPQTSFPVAGSGLRVFPTPVVPTSQNLPLLRLYRPTPTPSAPKFYPLYPTPKPTPSRNKKPKAPPGRSPEMVPSWRQIHLPTPGSATAPGSRQIRNPNQGSVSVLGPRQIRYPSLYQDSQNNPPGVVPSPPVQQNSNPGDPGKN